MSVLINASTSTGLVQSADTSGEIELQSNGTTALKVNTNEGIQILNCLGVGNATPSTSGAGITFPATQSASSNANTLDDYEEGTWTPTDASGASLSLSITSATYIKIGRQVFVTCYVSYPSTADTNPAKIGGFPFASTSGEVYSYFGGRSTYSNYITWQLGSGSTQAGCHGGGGATTINNNNLSSSFIIWSGAYTASA